MGLDDFVADATTDTLAVDFSAALDFDPLEGEFDFVIIDALPGTSRAGDPKITAKVEVIDGEKKGRKAQKDLPLKGKGSGITKKFLTVTDYPGGWERAESEGVSLSALKGLTFTGLCRKSKFNEDFTDIYQVKPLQAGGGL